MDITVYFQWLEKLTPIASVASIVALGFAIYQTWESKRLTKQLSTQFKGHFPDYLPNVADLIRGAKHSLKIMATIPSHGEYSDPKAWRKITEAIASTVNKGPNDSKPENFEAVLIFSRAEAVLESFSVQHSELADHPDRWEKWKKTEIDSGRLGRFLQGRPEANRIASLTVAEYLRVRVQKDREAINHFFGDFQLMECNDPLPLFCWIADDRNAIFSIRTEDTEGHYIGAGIFTADEGLVRILRNMFKHCRKTKPVNHPISEHYRSISAGH